MGYFFNILIKHWWLLLFITCVYFPFNFYAIVSHNIILLAISASLLVLTVIGTFSFLLFRKGKYSKQEEGLSPVFEANNGGGYFQTGPSELEGHFTSPFVNLRFYEDFFVISYVNQIVLNYRDVEQIERGYIPFTKGIKILHNRKDIPKKIFLSTFKDDRIIKFIQKKIGKL